MLSIRCWFRLAGGSTRPSWSGSISTFASMAAVGRRVSTLCKGEEGLRQLLVLYQTCHNFCLPHTSVHQALPQPVSTKGMGSVKQ